jgi:hypothetical protein
MTTVAEFVTKTRNFLKDQRQVTDEEIIVFLGDAIADYSYHFPRGKVATVTPTGGVIALPADSVQDIVDGIEVDGTLWSEYTPEPGKALPTSGNCWYRYGDSIKLAAVPAGAVNLHYRAMYPIPVSAGEEIEVPRVDDELLVIYAAAKFHQKIGTVTAKLDRFREKGERDENPLIFMHDVLIRQYEQKVADRKRRGAVRLRRI